MMKEKKLLIIKPLNHFVALYSLIVVAFVLAFFLWAVDFNQSVFKFLSVFFLINAAPVFYLHISYWMKSVGQEFIIDGERLTRKHQGEQQVFKTDEIRFVEISLSPSMYKGNSLQVLPFESYHYAKVYLKNGEEMVITCLLAPKLDAALKGLRGVRIERKKRFFNSLR
jgi:hypothetical protein